VVWRVHGILFLFFVSNLQRILMQDFPANSQQAKATEAPREKLKPVTSAETVRRKKGLGRQFKQTFFSGTARDAAEYMVTDVVVPAIRDMLYDAMQSGIDRLIYGEKSSHRPRSSSIMSPNVGHVNYAGISANKPPQQQRTLSRRSRARHSLEELVIPSHQEANEVLDRMYDVLSRYGQVSVADLYELTGVRSEHTDVKWGWTNLRGAKAVRLRQGGYLLDLPEPEALG
jgi:hypothetical protein